jgi:threonine/homoserine/homoserine lactone efflux protein
MLAFFAVALLVTLTPGPATALVVRSALRGGQREASMTIVGNSVGVLAWAVASVVGISALVAASEAAFLILKVVGACVLVYLGVQSLRQSRSGGTTPREGGPAHAGRPLRYGLINALANPKLAVFFVALFPQFVPQDAPVLGYAMLMAGTIVALDVIWYSIVAAVVSRTRRRLVGGRMARSMERLTGTVMVGLGLRLAIER